MNQAELIALAQSFHDTYERLAPSFGYVTREDTRSFDITSMNGQLMVAVVQSVMQPAIRAAYARGVEAERERAAIPSVKATDLSGHTDLFGWTFSEGGSTGLITIYIEDDENWHPKMTFDRYWLGDLARAVAAAIRRGES